ncbi:MAG: MotA/TolQ/ExbB proton channel family protein [bacterium]
MGSYLSFAIALQSFPQSSSLSHNVLDLVLNAGIVAKTVLAILLLFSVVSWAIIFDKLRVFRRLRKESEEFLLFFRKHKGAREIFQAGRKYPTNPFFVVFKEAYWLINKEEGSYSDSSMAGTVELLREQRTKKSHTSEDLVRLFDSVASREVLGLEKHLVFLATTGSVSPFFGLFGTVWGVMSAFMAIGYTGSADLSVVAPGIAEALITTVAGLGAAIPAVIAYNYFVNRLKRLSSQLEIYYSDLIEVFAKKEVHEVR